MAHLMVLVLRHCADLPEFDMPRSNDGEDGSDMLYFSDDGDDGFEGDDGFDGVDGFEGVDDHEGIPP
jgi:hypothetical protein